MNDLFALIERENMLSLTIGERGEYALPTCFSEEKNEKQVAKRGNCWLIFEGKLFNQKNLISNHSETDSHSDADVVLELFLQKGTQSFVLLEGYWSVIAADMDKKKIYAARDHFGNRPLYYCKTDTQFGIASRSKTLFSAMKNAGKINENAVFEFLLWGDAAKHQQNFFSDIHELKPSCYLSYSLIDNSLEEQPYYILPYKNCKAGYNEYEEPFYIDKTRQFIFETVQNNIKGKNKIAIGLSGGLDSSALLCCAKKLNPDLQIVAFTSTNSHNEGETFWAEKIIKHTNADWVKVPCTSRHIIEQLPRVNSVQNIPVFYLNSVAQHRVMEAVKQSGFESVMDGQGADELFAGYTSYFLPFLKSLRSQWMFKDWGKELLHLHNSNTSCKEIIARKLKNLAKKHYYTEENLAKKTKFQELSLLNDEYKNHYFRCLTNNQHDKTVLNDYLYESYTIFLPYLLRFGEHIAASFGMDCQMPFANSKNLAEYVFSVPSTFKIHNGWTKYLLRSAMVGIVPDEIRWRKQKLGFYVPEREWLNEIGNEIKEQIHQLKDLDNFINKHSLITKWEDLYRSDNVHFQQFAFRYYSYLVWREGCRES